MSTSPLQANHDLDAMYGSGTPATIYACLTTTAPSLSAGGGAGTIVQPTGLQDANYAEVALTNDVGHFPAASGGIKQPATFAFPASAAGAIANTPLTHLVLRTNTTVSGTARIIDAIALPVGTVITPSIALTIVGGSLSITRGPTA